MKSPIYIAFQYLTSLLLGQLGTLLHYAVIEADVRLFMIGKTVGNFQITSLIGKGGMGEVYQAKDLKLGRDVAIKVLAEEFARDADRVARFQREAKPLASLNNPNIGAVHSLEEVKGTNFLVMELVDGETLEDRMGCGSIPIEESLKLGLQIAEALEAAHEKTIIHRDLKSSNLNVTPESNVSELPAKVRKVLSTPSYRENALRISAKLKQYGGASKAAQLIEDYLIQKHVIPVKGNV
jgi:serine/threonine protein kinase